MRVYGRGGIAVRVGSGGSVKRTAGGGRTRTESKPASLWWAGGAGSSALSCELSLLAGACSHVDPATRCIHPSAAQVNPDHAQTPARTADMVLPSSRCCMVQPSIHHATRCLPAPVPAANPSHAAHRSSVSKAVGPPSMRHGGRSITAANPSDAAASLVRPGVRRLFLRPGLERARSGVERRLGDVVAVSWCCVCAARTFFGAMTNSQQQ
jgi:hypothetical protein